MAGFFVANLNTDTSDTTESIDDLIITPAEEVKVEKEDCVHPPIEEKLLSTLALAASLKKPTALPKALETDLYHSIDHFDDEKILNKLSLFIPEDDIFEYIDDYKTFSKRLVEELGNRQNSTSQSPVSSDYNAQIYFSQSPDYPNDASSTFTDIGNHKVYAHIYVEGATYSKKLLFTRWKSLSTGKILLFTQKYINPDSDTNWVSLSPGSKWESGEYEVTFYDFNSKLKLIAKANFTVKN